MKRIKLLFGLTYFKLNLPAGSDVELIACVASLSNRVIVRLDEISRAEMLATQAIELNKL